MSALELLIFIFLSSDAAWEYNKTAEFKEELYCVTLSMYREARGEKTENGELSPFSLVIVGQSIRNRYKERSGYGKKASYCAEVMRGDAYEFTEFWGMEAPEIKEDQIKDINLMIQVAAQVLNGDYDGAINGSTHYANMSKVTPCWKEAYNKSQTHINHTFVWDYNGGTQCLDRKRRLAAVPLEPLQGNSAL